MKRIRSILSKNSTNWGPPSPGARAMAPYLTGRANQAHKAITNELNEVPVKLRTPFGGDSTTPPPAESITLDEYNAHLDKYDRKYAAKDQKEAKRKARGWK